MNKLALLIASFVTMLCPQGLCAQENSRQVLTLDQLFALADQNSKSLRPATTAINESEQAIKVARQAQLPDINASISASFLGNGCLIERDLSSGIKAPIPHWGNNFALEVSQVIYAGGAINRNINRSKLQQKEAELEYVRNRQDIRFMLTGYYLDLFQLNNQKRVYENNIAQTQLLVKDMRASYRQGTALKSDITRYELQLQSLELQLTSVKDKIDVLSHRLATTIGLEPDVAIQPDTTELFRLTVEKRDEAEWIREIPLTPSVRLADVKIEQEKNRIELLRAEKRPRISLHAANDLNGPILIEVPPLNNNFSYWYAGVGISYNLDALFKNGKKLKQARLSALKMEEARKLAVEETGNSIHEAYVNLNEAYIRLRTQKKSVQLAHENFNIVRQRYVNGLALITDMLDASNTQLDMELQLANYQIGLR